jgi:hypothetical protein
MANDTRSKYDVFISYSTKDKKWADAACSLLEKHKIRCWIAPRDITPGTEWGASIISGMDGSKIMLLIFSAHANQSAQVRREVERAIGKGLIVLPFRIEDVSPEGAMEYALSNTHWLDGFTPPIERQYDLLAKSVTALLGKDAQPDVAPAAASRTKSPAGSRSSSGEPAGTDTNLRSERTRQARIGSGGAASTSEVDRTSVPAPGQRRTLWLSAIAASLFGLAALLVGLFVTQRDEAPPPELAKRVALPATADRSKEPVVSHEGWVQLFDGKSLSGWTTANGASGNWRVENGAITCSGPASHLFSQRGDFKDFRYRAEIKINENGNSGQFFRAQKNPGVPRGYEAQINSAHTDPIRTGSLYGFFPVTEMLVPPETWFTQEVEAVGNHIVIKVNDKVTVDYTDPQNSFTEGHFAFQHFGPTCRVDIRRIEIQELQGPPIVASTPPRPFPRQRPRPPGAGGALAVASRKAEPPNTLRAQELIPAAGPARRAQGIFGAGLSVEGDQIVKEGLGFGAIIFGDSGWRDYDVDFEACKSAGPDGLGAGFRVNDGGFYWLTIGGLGGKHSLGKNGQKVGGLREIKSTPGTSQPLEWYRLRISLRGQRILIELQGQVLFDCVDNFSRNGNFAVRWLNSAGRFRNIKITAPDGTVLWQGAPDLPEPGSTPTPAPQERSKVAVRTPPPAAPPDPEKDPKLRATLKTEYKEGLETIKRRALLMNTNDANKLRRTARDKVLKELASKHKLEVDQVSRMVSGKN